MLNRVVRADIPNLFSAHPDIAADISGPLDFAGAMTDANVFLFGEHGGLIFEWKGPGTYETHVMLTKAGRGRWGFAAVAEACGWMEANGANHLWARIHPERPEIAALAQRSGFRPAGHHELQGVCWRIYNRRT